MTAFYGKVIDSDLVIYSDLDEQWRLFEIQKNKYCAAKGVQIEGELCWGPGPKEQAQEKLREISNEETEYTVAISEITILQDGKEILGCSDGYKRCNDAWCCPNECQCDSIDYCIGCFSLE